jgi:hypothetical protein
MILAWFLIFVLVGYCGDLLIKPIVGMSGFRLSISGKKDIPIDNIDNTLLFMGNSRVMGGVNSKDLNRYNKNKNYYNLAYNGLVYADISALIDTYLNSFEGKVTTVFLNSMVLPQKKNKNDEKIETVSDVQIFLSAFNMKLQDKISKKDTKLGIKLSLFPLLHFNNELFLRSIYYLAVNKNDQDYANNYKVKLTSMMIERLKRTRFNCFLDIKEVEKFKKKLNARGIQLVVITFPFHLAYIKNVKGFKQSMENILLITDKLHIKYYDHSELYIKKNEFFSDPQHLNMAGQKKYTQYLNEFVLNKKI